MTVTAAQIRPSCSLLRPLRVLHVSAGKIFGGVERLLVTLANQRHLCAEMDPSFALCFEGCLAEELQPTGVRLDILGSVRLSRPWSVWSARRQLRNLLQRDAVDVVVCHGSWSHAVFASAVRAAGIPVAFWAHDVMRGTHWLERRAARSAPDLVLANSRYTLGGISRLFPRAHAEVFHCPVPAPHTFTAAQRVSLRAELRTPLEDVVIVLASRMDALKGHATLLNALAALVDVKNWRCWIVGAPQRPQEEEYLNLLRALAATKQLDARIQFLGQRSDVPRLLHAADIYCQPNSGPESFGIAFVEAMYAGLPVVTTDMGAAPEVVGDSCGVLVPSQDEKALAAALRSLICDQRHRASIGALGRERAANLCDPRASLTSLRDILHRSVVAG